MKTTQTPTPAAQILGRTAEAAHASTRPEETNLARLLHGALALAYGTPTDTNPADSADWLEWAETVALGNWETMTGGELLDLAARERRATVRVAPFDLAGLDAWTGTLDSDPVAWGTADRRLALSTGRPTLLYGNDGAGKTNLAGLLVAGLLGHEGYGDLLGAPVHPLDDDDAVLYLALDGPQETRESFARFGLGVGSERFTVFAASAPWNPSEASADVLARFVSEVEARTRDRYAYVVVDNAQRAYGPVDQPHRSAELGNALTRLSDDDRGVLVLAQSRKNGKPRSKDDAMVGANGLSGTGSILSLDRLTQGARDGSKPTRSELRQHKGLGADDKVGFVVEFNLATGRARLEGDGALSDKDLAAWAALPAVGTFTAADCRTIWDDSKATAQRRLGRLETALAVLVDHEAARGQKHYRRGTL